MQNKIGLTDNQITFIKKLENYKSDVWNTSDTTEIINIAQKVLSESQNIEPAKIKIANGTERIDHKGKQLMLKGLENDILALKNKGYSNIKNEKFAIVTSIQLLMGTFSMLSANDLTTLIQK